MRVLMYKNDGKMRNLETLLFVAYDQLSTECLKQTTTFNGASITYTVARTSMEDDNEASCEPGPCVGPTKCGENKFCVGYEPQTGHVYCYGKSNGCKWSSNDCATDSDCSKYTTSSPKYTDRTTCPGSTGWRADACTCSSARSQTSMTFLSQLKNASTHPSGTRLKVRPFSHLSARKEPQSHYTSEQLAEKVAELVHLANDAFVQIKMGKGRWKPGLRTKFGGACEHSQLRTAMLNDLRKSGKGSDTAPRRFLALKVFSACSGLINRDRDVQTDLLKIARDSDATEFVRTRSLYPLFQIQCPSHSSIEAVKQLATDSADKPTTRMSEVSVLVLGGFIQHVRKCNRTLAPRIIQQSEEFLNNQLRLSLNQRDLSRAKTILLAMSNSGSGSHLKAIEHAIEHHMSEMRSLSLKASTIEVLDSVARHPHDTTLRLRLLRQMHSPVTARNFNSTIRTTDLGGMEDAGFGKKEALKVFRKLEKEKEEKDETEDECPAEETWEKPFLCVGKQVPESGIVRLSLGAQAGIGNAKDEIAQKAKLIEDACTKYLFFEAKMGIVVEINGPFDGVDGVDPFALGPHFHFF